MEFAKNKKNLLYSRDMAKTARVPVFFIATKTRDEPATVSFYTNKGKPVAFRAVKKVKTKEGVHFYAKTVKGR